MSVGRVRGCVYDTAPPRLARGVQVCHRQRHRASPYGVELPNRRPLQHTSRAPSSSVTSPSVVRALIDSKEAYLWL